MIMMLVLEQEIMMVLYIQAASTVFPLWDLRSAGGARTWGLPYWQGEYYRYLILVIVVVVVVVVVVVMVVLVVVVMVVLVVVEIIMLSVGKIL